MSEATCGDVDVPGYRAARSSGLRTAFINIIEPDDVVLAEITTGLHLDQFERDLAGIGEAVNRADRDISRLVLVDGFLQIADGDLRGPPHHDPVLGAVQMLLQRQDPAGGDDEALDLEAFAGVDGFIMPPGPVSAA